MYASFIYAPCYISKKEKKREETGGRAGGGGGVEDGVESPGDGLNPVKREKFFANTLNLPRGGGEFESQIEPPRPPPKPLHHHSRTLP